jgi:hypothetical protein
MNKWLDRIKKISLEIQQDGDKVDLVENHAILSTLSPPTLRNYENKSYLNRCKIGKLKTIIKHVSDINGGDNESFLNEYIEDIISEWLHDIDKALTCFSDLAEQMPSVNNRK